MDSQTLRNCLRCFAHGVTIIAVGNGDEIHGMTATAVCSVSLAPPLILVCVKKDTRTHRYIKDTGAYSVNLLHEAQRELAQHFASDTGEGTSRFDGLRYRTVTTGAPVLNDVLGFFDCRVVASHDGGDHTIFVGHVEAAGQHGDAMPLVFHAGCYLPVSRVLI